MTLSLFLETLLMAACDSSLEMAGGALCASAWPVLRSALHPVLDRLGGYEVLNSRQRALAAAMRFARDAHLQEMLRSSLIEQLDRCMGEPGIEADAQPLMELLERACESQAASAAQGNATHEAASSIDRLSSQAWSCRKLRTLARHEIADSIAVVRRQAERLHLRSAEAIRSGRPLQAREELQESLLLLAMLLSEAPTSVELRIHFGLAQRRMGQICAAAGETIAAKRYTLEADEMFRLLRLDASQDPGLARATADTLQALAHDDHQRRNLEGAIDKYRLATQIHPDSVYVWHDLFVALYEHAKQGHADRAALRQALDELKQRGEGRPGLTEHHLARLERSLQALEAQLDRRTECAAPGAGRLAG